MYRELPAVAKKAEWALPFTQSLGDPTFSTGTHEDDQRERTGLDADLVHEKQQSARFCNARTGYVAEQATEADRYEQERFELLDYAEVQQRQADGEHDHLAAGQLVDAGLDPDLANEIHQFAALN